MNGYDETSMGLLSVAIPGTSSFNVNSMHCRTSMALGGGNKTHEIFLEKLVLIAIP